MPLQGIEPRTGHHRNVKTNHLLPYKSVRCIKDDAIFHTTKAARVSISLRKRVMIWFSITNEIAKFLKWKLRKPEKSNTHLHGAVTPKQTISWPTTAALAPNLITNIITFRYVKFYICQYSATLIYYGQAAGSPLVRIMSAFWPWYLLIPNIFVGISLYSI
jgi:hypothetical protein